MIAVELQEETHEYTAGGRKLIGVTSLLSSFGFIDASWYTEAARERGSRVHETTKLLDLGLISIEDVPAEHYGYAAAWLLYRKESGFEPLPEWIEEPAASALGFAGTPDRVGTVPVLLSRRFLVLDIKTGAIPAWAALQTAGYRILFAEATGTPLHMIDRVGVQLFASGRYTTKPFNDRTDDAVFRGLLLGERWKEEHGISNS